MGISRRRWGFTLIELLIVVAIIAILAAISVPNLLEAQIRSKVSRVKADMKSVVTALASYVIDERNYPAPIGYLPPPPFTIVIPPSGAFEGFVPFCMTSPVSYLSTLPLDLFEVGAEDAHPKRVTFHYSLQRVNARPPINQPTLIGDLAVRFDVGGRAFQYVVLSNGPDLRPQDGSPTNGEPAIYDPTNGTQSAGDVYAFGP